MTSPALLQASKSKRTESEVRARRSATQDRRTEGENPPPVHRVHKCPDTTKPASGDLVGCGARFEQDPDREGWVDCPSCGLAFNATTE